MPWVDFYQPGTTLKPGKIQCDICKAVSKSKFFGMKGCQKIAGANFPDKTTWGCILCPLCQKGIAGSEDSPRSQKKFTEEWLHALPVPANTQEASSSSSSSPLGKRTDANKVLSAACLVLLQHQDPVQLGEWHKSQGLTVGHTATGDSDDVHREIIEAAAVAHVRLEQMSYK